MSAQLGLPQSPHPRPPMHAFEASLWLTHHFHRYLLPFARRRPPDEHARGRPVASPPQDRLNSPSGAQVSSEARGPIHFSRVSAPFAESASPHHTCAYVGLGK
jgi:hypothetical protein